MSLFESLDARLPSAQRHDAFANPSRVLLGTQDHAIRDRIQRHLEQQGIAVATAGSDAADRLKAQQFSLVVLDAQLEPLDEFGMLRKIRAQSDVPVIMITRKSRSEIDYVIGLELGADDFICEPINPREILARGRAILRRQEKARQSLCPSPRGGYRFEGWELRRRTRTLTDPQGRVVALTKNEYALLAIFLDAPGRTLSRLQLMRVTRPHEDIYDRTIDVQVLRLRRKLEADRPGPPLIRTQRGIGYCFDAAVETFL